MVIKMASEYIIIAGIRGSDVNKIIDATYCDLDDTGSGNSQCMAEYYIKKIVLEDRRQASHPAYDSFNT